LARITEIAWVAVLDGVYPPRPRGSDRVARLVAAGVPATELERVQAPIGLDLGSQTAEETALAILAEMVAVRHGKAGGPMRALTTAAS
jgi:xanthine dehydrogenase accessory factor